MVSSAGPSVGQRGLRPWVECESKVELSDHTHQLNVEGLGVSNTVRQEGEDLAGRTVDKEHEPQRWQLS